MPGQFLTFANKRGNVANSSMVGAVDRLLDRASYRMDAVVRGVMAEAATRLAAATPVDTGYMVGQWHVTIDAPDPSWVSPLDPGRGTALEHNLAIIATLRAGDKAYLANYTPYLPHVEYGTSRMAPRAFVRGVQAQMPGVARQVIARVRGQDAPEGYYRLVAALFGR
jgi:hypothetical protein